MKKKYDVEMLTWSSLRTIEEAKKDNDLETFWYEGADNYREAVSIAKQKSTRIGQMSKGKEIVSVRIMCYTDDDEFYDSLWIEEYRNGKKVSREEY